MVDGGIIGVCLGVHVYPSNAKRTSRPKAETAAMQSQQMQEQQSEILRFLGGMQGRIGSLEATVGTLQGAPPPSKAVAPALLSPFTHPWLAIAGAPSPGGCQELSEARRT
eukprot:44072-Amphidinium_carterae.3